MQTITTIGLDIAKSVFQVHGVDAAGEVVIRRQLKRRSAWRSSRSCPRVWSALRRAHRRTIGRANCRHLAIPCD
jgi:transposase